MAVQSRSNTRHRRSQWKAQPTELVPTVLNGREVQLPRRLVRAAYLALLRESDVRQAP